MRPGLQEERWAELWSQEEKPLRLAPSRSPVVCRAICGQGPSHSDGAQSCGQPSPRPALDRLGQAEVFLPAPVSSQLPQPASFPGNPVLVHTEKCADGATGLSCSPPGSVGEPGAWKETGAAWGDRWASSLGRIRGGPGGTPGRPAPGHGGPSSAELGKRERARSE